MCIIQKQGKKRDCIFEQNAMSNFPGDNNNVERDKTWNKMHR